MTKSQFSSNNPSKSSEHDDTFTNVNTKLTEADCDNHIAAIKQQLTNNRRHWEMQVAYFREQKNKAQAFSTSRSYDQLINNINSEEKAALEQYNRERGLLIKREAGFQDIKLFLQQKNEFGTYKKMMQTYLANQGERLAKKAPFSDKKKAFDGFAVQVEKAENVEKLKELLPVIREKAKHHRETGILKFNWLRRPASLSNFGDIFDKANKLRRKI